MARFAGHARRRARARATKERGGGVRPGGGAGPERPRHADSRRGVGPPPLIVGRADDAVRVTKRTWLPGWWLTASRSTPPAA